MSASETKSEELSCMQRYISWRYVIVILLETSIVVTTMMRNAMPMAIVCMVRPGPLTSVDKNSTANSAKAWHGLHNYTNHSRETFEHQYPSNATVRSTISANQVATTYEFDWDSETVGIILGSFLFSAFLSPLLSNVVRERLGNKLSMLLVYLISALLSFLSPISARTSPYLLVVVRVLFGVTLRANVPVIHDTLAWWAPQSEKLTMVAIVNTGFGVGAILTSVIAGYLCLVPADNGWPFVFYTFGIVSLLWCVVWYCFSSRRPENHPFISEKEKEYIMSNRTGMAVSEGMVTRTPYVKILTSVPVLAALVSSTASIWTVHTATYYPSYFNRFLNFSVQDTGLWTSLINVGPLVGTFFWTIIANKITAKLGTNWSRKICIGLVFSMAGVSQLGVAFIGDGSDWLTVALILYIVMNQTVGDSFVQATYLDMAPRYAGFISGFISSVGVLISISSPQILAAIVGEGSAENWRTAWIVVAGVFFVAAIAYPLFGQASLQTWAKPLAAKRGSLEDL